MGDKTYSRERKIKLCGEGKFPAITLCTDILHITEDGVTKTVANRSVIKSDGYSDEDYLRQLILADARYGNLMELPYFTGMPEKENPWYDDLCGVYKIDNNIWLAYAKEIEGLDLSVYDGEKSKYLREQYNIRWVNSPPVNKPKKEIDLTEANEEMIDGN